MLSRIGLSYSSTRTTTRSPLRLVGAADQLGEAAGDARCRPRSARRARVDSLPGARGSRRSSASRLVEHAAGEVEPDDRVAARPVPMLMDMQPAKQRLAALEQLFQGIQEQALAEAARARQEEMLAALGQRPGVRGLVDVDIALLDDLAEGLDADGELLQHGRSNASPNPPHLLRTMVPGAVPYAIAGNMTACRERHGCESVHPFCGKRDGSPAVRS
jgi:hypothetical protein